MDFPEFKTDAEMAAWFETHDVSADDLEVADDVVVSPTLRVTVVSEVYSIVRNRISHSANSNSAAAAARVRYPERLVASTS